MGYSIDFLKSKRKIELSFLNFNKVFEEFLYKLLPINRYLGTTYVSQLQLSA
jgi:hypothetical protein